MSLTSEQLRAARALLRMEQTELAGKSGVSLGTIRRLESLSGPINAQESTLSGIKGVLEAAGVDFIDNDEQSGVALIKAPEFAMTDREKELTAALQAIQSLLDDWPTMRALSASGAEKATANKVEARRIIADALDNGGAE